MTKKLFDFIEKSVSPFHTIHTIVEELQKNNFCELIEGEAWEIKPGTGYYVVRGDSSIIAWKMPENEMKGYHIGAAHSDSPSFLIKHQPELPFDQTYIRLNTEKYGGMIMSSWMDRPLSLAGRVVIKQDGKLITKLVNIDRDLLVIPNMAIHMEPKLNKGFEYNPQIDMLPLYREYESEITFDDMICQEVSCEKDELLSKELYLYNREKGRRVGAGGEWILAPRLDDLQCVFGLLESLKDASPKDYVSMMTVFNNEEVGSSTRQGADSTFLEDVICWISEALSQSPGESRALLSKSFLISADNAHGVHPAHPEKADPTNRPVLNGGVVIKYHGGQKYTSDGYTSAVLCDYGKRAGIQCQSYHNRSDVAGGSTLGNISISHLSIPSVDIGLPQLSMHSAMEMAGDRDLSDFIALMKEFY